MPKRTFIIILLLALVSLTIAPLAFAANTGEPVGSCPDTFQLSMAGMHDHQDHDHNTMHEHIGLDHDLNGDGYWCVKHVGVAQNLHVHIDNVAQLP